MTWSTVEDAIRDALGPADGLHAVDPAALADGVSWQKPNPRRTPTVRRTGSEGRRAIRDPLQAVARARMRRLLEELPDLMGSATVAHAYGWTKRLAAALHRRPEAMYDLAEMGRERLERRMREVGLLEAA